MEKQINKFKKLMHFICEILEQLVALMVLAGILLSAFSIVSDITIFQNLFHDTSAFRAYLEDIFTIVIGIEFLAMLCHPNSDNVMEVLIFLIARHMIVGETTPYEDFVSVISVALLFLLRRYLKNTEKKPPAEGSLDRNSRMD